MWEVGAAVSRAPCIRFVGAGTLQVLDLPADGIVNVVNDMPTANALTTDSLTLANRLRPVLLKLTRELRREAHALGVTGGQASLLFAIQQSPGIGVRELAEQERMSAPALSGYVDRLEKAGFVARTPSPTDRRRVGLTVTPAGKRVLRSVKARRTAWLAARLQGLADADLAAVDRAIEPLYELISA